VTVRDRRGTVPPPPRPPVTTDGGAVDEGPLRRELLRQIGELEEQWSIRRARRHPWSRERTSRRRGPALLATADLEAIRDELLNALHGEPRAPGG
jgi:hypothetical protein